MNRSRLAALSAGAMFLVASVIVPATALAAGSGSVSLSPATVSATTGSTFTVTITSRADTAMSGASAAIDFDRSKLQIVSVTKGADWDAPAPAWQFPTVGDIANANSSGHLEAIAAYFTDGSSSLPANADAVLATVSFFAYASGTPTISITGSGPDRAAIIDGAAGTTYGSPVVTTAGSTAVTITAGANPNDSISASITGSVAAPALAMTCPSSVTVPLVRNSDNRAPFECTVNSDGAWTISVKDTNPDANHGFMVDSSASPVKVLANSLRIETPQFDHNLAGNPDLFPIYASQANAVVPMTFKQVVNPGDKPGQYGMNVLFSIVNTF